MTCAAPANSLQALWLYIEFLCVHPSLPMSSFSLNTLSFPCQNCGTQERPGCSTSSSVTSCSETCGELLLPRTLYLSFLTCSSRLFFPSETEFISYPSRRLCQTSLPYNFSVGTVPGFTWPTSFRTCPLLECLPSTQTLLNLCFKAHPCQSPSL